MHHFLRDRRWFGLCSMLMLMGLIAGLPEALADTKKFTLINVLLDDTKIWLPSTLVVQQGDEVELTLINKLEEAHGFKIAAFGIEDVVQPKAQIIVRFTAKTSGAHAYVCHIHPPHIGGQLLVFAE